ncbi:MAG: hypothetical protein KUA37_18350 [Desulfomicrobium sp.]|nr:hypothetical protein [Desulfomicrobium sp.]MBV1719912.1 hypothetical protein [Desulfomicrobium sp.]MBV1748789.1 hypothetical protein [Desulfomicrobium sp.]
MKKLEACASPHKLFTERASLRNTVEEAIKTFRTNQLNSQKIQTFILSYGEKRKSGRQKELKKQGKSIFMDTDHGSAKNAEESYARFVAHRSTTPWDLTCCMTMDAVHTAHAFQSTAGVVIRNAKFIGNGTGTNKPRTQPTR